MTKMSLTLHLMYLRKFNLLFNINPIQISKYKRIELGIKCKERKYELEFRLGLYICTAQTQN